MSAGGEYEAARQHMTELINDVSLNGPNPDPEKANLFRAIGHFMNAVEKDMNTIKSRLSAIER